MTRRKGTQLIFSTHPILAKFKKMCQLDLLCDSITFYNVIYLLFSLEAECGRLILVL